jgi:hypothetical protein
VAEALLTSGSGVGIASHGGPGACPKNTTILGADKNTLSQQRQLICLGVLKLNAAV